MADQPLAGSQDGERQTQSEIAITAADPVLSPASAEQHDGDKGMAFNKALEKTARTRFSREDDVQRWVSYWGETVKRNEELLRAFQGRAELDFAGKVVLDVGCGTGGLAKTICEAGGRYVGVDFHYILSFAALLIGDLDTDRASIARSSATHLPLISESVDYVIAFDVVEHLVGGYQWQLQFMREMQRVLRPGGLILFTTQNKLYPMEGHTFLPFPHYLPSALADRYVRWRRPGFFEEYDSFKEVVLLSPWALRRLLKQSSLALLHDLPWCMDREDHRPRERHLLRLLHGIGLDWGWTKGFWLVAARQEDLPRVRELKRKQWLRE